MPAVGDMGDVVMRRANDIENWRRKLVEENEEQAKTIKEMEEDEAKLRAEVGILEAALETAARELHKRDKEAKDRQLVIEALEAKLAKWRSPPAVTVTTTTIEPVVIASETIPLGPGAEEAPTT